MALIGLCVFAAVVLAALAVAGWTTCYADDSCPWWDER